MNTEAILYTRPGCGLCDEAEALLKRYGITPQTVNIDEHPEWTERYDTCVPVVWINGKERFRGRINEMLLKRLLRAEG